MHDPCSPDEETCAPPAKVYPTNDAPSTTLDQVVALLRGTIDCTCVAGE